MSESEAPIKLTPQQQRILKLVFKFRFVTAQNLAIVMGIRRRSVYTVLEYLVSQKVVEKVYKEEWRLLGRPAYYYLSKPGVTTVRKLLDVSERVVNSHYKNAVASQEQIDHSLTALGCYTSLIRTLPKGTTIFAKSELGRFKQFPKNRPDLYIRTSDDSQAMVLILDNKPKYIIKKRIDEIISHFEDEGWEDGDYPHICCIFKDGNQKNSFLYGTHKKLDSMGMDEDEIVILATHLGVLKEGNDRIWSSAFNPKSFVRLFE